MPNQHTTSSTNTTSSTDTASNDETGSCGRKTQGTKVALITGGARRIGAAIVKMLHGNGYNVIVHYHHSDEEAEKLIAELLSARPNSATTICADLQNLNNLSDLCKAAINQWERIDLLVNNASTFYPTPINPVEDETETACGAFKPEEWDQIINTNLRAPYFLAVSLAEELHKTSGAIINLVDIYSERPLKDHSIYNISKSGMAMTTKTLARELGPRVRVNGVSPGAILWPESDAEIESQESSKSHIINQTPLKRCGTPADICEAVNYLATSTFVTGQIINIDGGRSLYL